MNGSDISDARGQTDTLYRTELANGLDEHMQRGKTQFIYKLSDKSPSASQGECIQDNYN